MTPLLFTPAARGDLDTIWRYTAEIWGVDQADSYIRAITTTCEGVAQGTRPSQSADHIRAGYRKVASGRHVIFFRQPGAALEVVRILHQRMDITDQLG
ncbi:MAG: type II toxin-antitoxin system RelE/ParE family toxin [Pseudomonadota bacterium]